MWKDYRDPPVAGSVIRRAPNDRLSRRRRHRPVLGGVPRHAEPASRRARCRPPRPEVATRTEAERQW